jgi:hypothetical protein
MPARKQNAIAATFGNEYFVSLNMINNSIMPMKINK